MSSDSLGRVVQELRHGRPELAFDQLTYVLLSGGSIEQLWTARCMLTQLVAQLPGGCATASRQEAARRCGVELPAPRSPIGRAEFPSIGSQRSRFIAVHIFEGTEQDKITPADLDQDTQAAVRDALAAARVVTGDPRPLCVSFALEEGSLYGRSCGLAVGVAAVSYLWRRALSELLLFTGHLRPDGRIDPVLHIPEKLALRRESRPGAVLLVPQGQESNAPGAQPVGSLQDAVRSHLPRPSKPAPALVRDVELELTRVRTEFRVGRWSEAEEGALALLANTALRTDEELALRIILLAAANHRGEQQRAAEISASMQAMLQDSSLPPDLIAAAMANVGMRLIDLLRPEEAEQILDQAERQPLAESDPVRVHLRGTRARARILRGDLHGALELRRRNAETCRDEEKARCLGDLVDIYVRLHEAQMAAQSLAEAERVLDSLCVSGRRVEYLGQTGRYLALYGVRLERLRGNAQDVRERLAAALKSGPVPLPELEIEAALLEPTAEQRFAAIDSVFVRIGERDQIIFRALYLRARMQAGDPGAQIELATLFGHPDLSARELVVRLPY